MEQSLPSISHTSQRARLCSPVETSDALSRFTPQPRCEVCTLITVGASIQENDQRGFCLYRDAYIAIGDSNGMRFFRGFQAIVIRCAH